jgi:hypothetical protein
MEVNTIQLEQVLRRKKGGIYTPCQNVTVECNLHRLKPARGQKKPATGLFQRKVRTKFWPPHLRGSTTRGSENPRGIGFFRPGTRKSRPVQANDVKAGKPLLLLDTLRPSTI